MTSKTETISNQSLKSKGSSASSKIDGTGLCPCGTGIDLSACCLPFIQGGKSPETAEQLLRSRYTAFTRGDVDYVLNTHHSKTRSEVKREEIEEWSKNSEWLGLQIAQIEAGKASDQQGTLIFCAKFKSKNSPAGASAKTETSAAGTVPTEQEHWEKSFFEKENGQWRFLDAQGVHIGTYKRAEPKIGRNDPCPCGSGKKHKKCCAI